MTFAFSLFSSSFLTAQESWVRYSQREIFKEDALGPDLKKTLDHLLKQL